MIPTFELRRRFALASWAAFLPLWALSAAGCGRVPGQFEIVNDQVPQEGCLIGVDETVYRGSGELDLSLVSDGASTAYKVFPLIKNNLPASAAGVDVNQIVLTSFAVDISPLGTVPSATAALLAALEGDAAGHALLHYQQPWSGSIASGGGKISASVPAFPVALAAQIRGTGDVGASPSLTMNLRVRVFGHTTSQDIESDPFDFPVALCAGCLVANVRACPYAAAPANAGNQCNIAQDTPVDCCTNNGNLVCPAVVSQ
jgi:hypothetical protein